MMQRASPATTRRFARRRAATFSMIAAAARAARSMAKKLLDGAAAAYASSNSPRPGPISTSTGRSLPNTWDHGTRASLMRIARRARCDGCISDPAPEAEEGGHPRLAPEVPGSAGDALFPRGAETGYMTPTTLSRIGGPDESCRLRRRIHRPVPRAGEAEPARPARRHRRDRSERRLPLGPVDHARLRPRPAGYGARPRGRRTRRRDGPRGVACEEGRPGDRVLRARVRRVLALSPRADRAVRARARGLDADARDPAGRQPVLLHDRPRHVRRGHDGRRGVGGEARDRSPGRPARPHRARRADRRWRGAQHGEGEAR